MEDGWHEMLGEGGETLGIYGRLAEQRHHEIGRGCHVGFAGKERENKKPPTKEKLDPKFKNSKS